VTDVICRGVCIQKALYTPHTVHSSHSTLLTLYTPHTLHTSRDTHITSHVHHILTLTTQSVPLQKYSCPLTGSNLITPWRPWSQGPLSTRGICEGGRWRKVLGRMSTRLVLALSMYTSMKYIGYIYIYTYPSISIFLAVPVHAKFSVYIPVHVSI